MSGPPLLYSELAFITPYLLESMKVSRGTWVSSVRPSFSCTVNITSVLVLTWSVPITTMRRSPMPAGVIREPSRLVG